MDVDVMKQVEAGRAEIDLKPSTNGNNGLYCTVERTNPDNPVRNIRVSSAHDECIVHACGPLQ
jgi:hypothetical protein